MISGRLRRSYSRSTGSANTRSVETYTVTVGAPASASVLLLVPGQSNSLIGAEVLVVGVAAYLWVSTIQLQRLREWSTMRSDLRGPLVLRVTFAQVSTIPMVVAGIAVLTVGVGGLYWIVASMVFSTLAAMFDAWVLLVEINR